MGNGFTEFATDTTFRKLFSAKFKDKPQAQSTAPKDISYIKLPFLDWINYETALQNDENLQPNFTQFKFRIIFLRKNIIGNYFKYKLYLPLRSAEIFQYKCSDCDIICIGKTIRNLSANIPEN